MEQKITNQELAKVMLQVKKEHDKALSKLEEKYDSELPEVSSNKIPTVFNELVLKLWIKTHLVTLNSNPGQTIMPYPSYEGEDLTEEGYAKLASLIDEFEKGRK